MATEKPKPPERDSVAYRGPERRQAYDAAFEKAVLAGVQIYAEEWARAQTRKSQITTVLVAVFCASLIALLVALLVKSSESSLIRAEGARSCALVQSISTLMSDFVSSDARLRRSQAGQKITERLVRDLTKVIPVRDLEASIRYGERQNTAIARYWSGTIAKGLDHLALVNCDAGLP